MWLSDALCRVATGGGFATRTLYEDDEETIFSYMRPVAVNGIDEIVTRHDLLDRSLIIHLPAIPEEERREAVQRLLTMRPGAASPGLPMNGAQLAADGILSLALG